MSEVGRVVNSRAYAPLTEGSVLWPPLDAPDGEEHPLLAVLLRIEPEI